MCTDSWGSEHQYVNSGRVSHQDLTCIPVNQKDLIHGSWMVRLTGPGQLKGDQGRNVAFVTFASPAQDSSLLKPLAWTNSKNSNSSKQIHFLPIYQHYDHLARVLQGTVKGTNMKNKQLKFQCFYKRLEAGTAPVRSAQQATQGKTRKWCPSYHLR